VPQDRALEKIESSRGIRGGTWNSSSTAGSALPMGALRQGDAVFHQCAERASDLLGQGREDASFVGGERTGRRVRQSLVRNIQRSECLAAQGGQRHHHLSSIRIASSSLDQLAFLEIVEDADQRRRVARRGSGQGYLRDRSAGSNFTQDGGLPTTDSPSEGHRSRTGHGPSELDDGVQDIRDIAIIVLAIMDLGNG